VISPSLSHLKHVLISHSFFFAWHSFAMCLYLLQLKYLGFVYGLTLSSICYFSTCLVIVVSFCKFVSLSNWRYRHFSLPITAGAGADDISVSVCLYSLEAFSVICKNSSHSDNALISFILLELILVPLHSLHYTCIFSDR